MDVDSDVWEMALDVSELQVEILVCCLATDATNGSGVGVGGNGVDVGS